MITDDYLFYKTGKSNTVSLWPHQIQQLSQWPLASNYDQLYFKLANTHNMQRLVRL